MHCSLLRLLRWLGTLNWCAWRQTAGTSDMSVEISKDCLGFRCFFRSSHRYTAKSANQRPSATSIWTSTGVYTSAIKLLRTKLAILRAWVMSQLKMSRHRRRMRLANHVDMAMQPKFCPSALHCRGTKASTRSIWFQLIRLFLNFESHERELCLEICWNLYGFHIAWPCVSTPLFCCRPELYKVAKL